MNCKFHKKQCTNKMACYIANKKEKRDLKANAVTEGEVVSDLSEFVCSRAHNNFTVSSPRMIEVENSVGIIDTGCNVLCLPDESSFDVLVKSSSNSKFKIADGKSISIEGTGTICDKEAKFVPDFKTTLGPPSAFTDFYIGIISSECIVPSSTLCLVLLLVAPGLS